MGPQLAQIKAWLTGENHPEHETFSMGRDFAQALVDEVDALRATHVALEAEYLLLLQEMDGDGK